MDPGTLEISARLLPIYLTFVGGSPWRCYCGRSYASSASLRRHRPDCLLSSEPYRDFLSLLACLGGSVPGDVFHRASSPASCWNEKGSPAHESLDGLPDFLANTSTLSEIIRAVQGVGVVQLEPCSIESDTVSPRWVSYLFRISPVLQEFIPRDLRPWKVDGETLLDSWKRQAVILLALTFPIEYIDRKFIQRGRAYTALLRPFLGDFLVTNFARSTQCARLVQACLTASKFSKKTDQELLLSTARRMISESGQTQSTLAIQLRLREQKVAQLFGGRLSNFSLPFPATNFGRALEAEVLLLRAQQDIEDGFVSRPCGYLHWKPMNAAQPSMIEEISASRITFLRGKLFRFLGDFNSSQKVLQLLTGQHPPPPCLFRIKLHLAAVCGELGLWLEAQQVLDSIQAVSEVQHRLVRLSRAELKLSYSLAVGGEDECGIDIFRELFHIYAHEDLEHQSKPFRRNLLRCCMGLAIASHLHSRYGNQISLINALGYWQTARAASRACLVNEEGFPDMICYLASAEVRFRLADPVADQDLLRAAEIGDRLEADGMQQRFVMTALGTRWADTLNDWIEAHGKSRILRKWTDSLHNIPILGS